MQLSSLVVRRWLSAGALVLILALLALACPTPVLAEGRTGIALQYGIAYLLPQPCPLFWRL